MAENDLPVPIRGAVKRAFEPDVAGRTYELDEPIVYTGYCLDERVFAWSSQDDDGLAWSMIVDLTGVEPVMAGIVVGSELQARAYAESAYRTARYFEDAANHGSQRRVS
jgi:hypothetical protein